MSATQAQMSALRSRFSHLFTLCLAFLNHLSGCCTPFTHSLAEAKKIILQKPVYDMKVRLQMLIGIFFLETAMNYDGLEICGSY